jgi:hypothetical protein
LQGSIPTPYIFDDRCDIRDVAKAIRYWFDTPVEERTRCGMAGHQWAISDESNFTAEKMCTRFREAVDATMQNWVAPKRFNLYNTREQINKFKNKKSGISI